MKWGTVLLVSLAVSIVTSDDPCDSTGISSHGLTKKLFLKAETLTTPFLYFFANEQEPSEETQTEPSTLGATNGFSDVNPIDQK